MNECTHARTKCCCYCCCFVCTSKTKSLWERKKTTHLQSIETHPSAPNIDIDITCCMFLAHRVVSTSSQIAFWGDLEKHTTQREYTRNVNSRRRAGGYTNTHTYRLVFATNAPALSCSANPGDMCNFALFLCGSATLLEIERNTDSSKRGKVHTHRVCVCVYASRF